MELETLKKIMTVIANAKDTDAAIASVQAVFPDEVAKFMALTLGDLWSMGRDALAKTTLADVLKAMNE